ncbi:MAG: T9SS type A sorting domain-containing protein [Bacteroidota bacterium]|nr:T9SS type A sorting domain-containing protein [Bacteroidota bacterium]
MKTHKIFLMLLVFNSFTYAGFDSLFVKVSGDTATVWHMNAGSQCVAKFVFDVSIVHDTITIIERDTSKNHAKCNCTFDLNVAIVHLDSGKYIVKVYRQELTINNYPKDTTYFIGSTNFMITNISVLPYFSFSTYQSGCGGVPVGIERTETSQPEITQLSNYPNPFNSSTVITFSIPRSMSNNRIELTIYDVQGREVKQLINHQMPEGNYGARWDGTIENGKAAASGIYFYHLNVGNQRQIGKMSLNEEPRRKRRGI